jgi:hypothetical protein
MIYPSQSRKCSIRNGGVVLVGAVVPLGLAEAVAHGAGLQHELVGAYEFDLQTLFLAGHQSLFYQDLGVAVFSSEANSQYFHCFFSFFKSLMLSR